MPLLGTVNATAPVRVCDIGGWTDTWFSHLGMVFNIAVTPGVEVRVRAMEEGSVPHRLTLDVVNFGDRYSFDPGDAPGRHPLLEAVIDDVGAPDGCALEVRVASDVPPGSSMGTSAAVAVALIGALDACASRRRTSLDVARAAHRIEVERLGLQSGVQDQLSAVFGGISFIEVDPYPEARRTAVSLHPRVREELERRLLVLYLGAHQSSNVHEQVIAGLGQSGTEAPQFEELRECAVMARDAVAAGDLEQLGRAMKQSTEAQRHLQEELVSAQAQAALEIAAARGATGWKINGAGGEGGSITFLGEPDADRRARLERDLVAGDPAWRVIPVRLSEDGLRVSLSE